MVLWIHLAHVEVKHVEQVLEEVVDARERTPKGSLSPAERKRDAAARTTESKSEEIRRVMLEKANIASQSQKAKGIHGWGSTFSDGTMTAGLLCAERMFGLPSKEGDSEM